MLIIDKQEVSAGGRNSGIIIRYRGNIIGVMILVGIRRKSYELSWMNYGRLKYFSRLKPNIVRIPFRKRAITF